MSRRKRKTIAVDQFAPIAVIGPSPVDALADLFRDIASRAYSEEVVTGEDCSRCGEFVRRMPHECAGKP